MAGQHFDIFSLAGDNDNHLFDTFFRGYLYLTKSKFSPSASVCFETEKWQKFYYESFNIIGKQIIPLLSSVVWNLPRMFSEYVHFHFFDEKFVDWMGFIKILFFSLPPSPTCTTFRLLLLQDHILSLFKMLIFCPSRMFYSLWFFKILHYYVTFPHYKIIWHPLSVCIWGKFLTCLNLILTLKRVFDVKCCGFPWLKIMFEN